MDKSKNIKRRLYNISKKTGKGQIYIYYSYNGDVKMFRTGITLDPKHWDKKNCKPKTGTLSGKDEQVVDKLYNWIITLITDYQYNNGTLPPIEYLEENIYKVDNTNDIHKIFQEFIEVKKSRVTENTVLAYTHTATVLKEVDTYYKYNLSLDNFNYSFIEKFITYSSTKRVRKNSNSTINVRLDLLKAFVNYLDKKEIPHNIKTANWDRLSEGKEDLICLERNELDEILAYKPTTEKEQKTKDIITFLSHTGIRCGDLSNIQKEHIINGCIDFYPEKTKSKRIKAIIPISKPVNEILTRYNYTLPTYHPRDLTKAIQEFCSNIESLKKELIFNGKVVPKYKTLKSHSIGRKTFINLCVQNSIPINLIMGMTAHNKIDTLLKSYLDKHLNALPNLKRVFEF